MAPANVMTQEERNWQEVSETLIALETMCRLRFDQSDKTQGEILAEAKQTNGRVTKLEDFRLKITSIWQGILMTLGAMTSIFGFLFLIAKIWKFLITHI